MNIELRLQQIKNFSIGNEIKDLLSSERVDDSSSFYFISAFVTKSGVSRIWDECKIFRSRGGKIVSIVGIDLGGTTSDGLELLNSVSNDLYIVHSTRPNVTFHPKIFVMELPDFAIVLAGSPNLTAGGFWTNIEEYVKIEFELPVDREKFDTMLNDILCLTDTDQEYIEKVNNSSLTKILKTLPNEFAGRNTRHILESRSKSSGIFGSGDFENAPVPSKNLPQTKSTIIRKHVEEISTGYNGFWKQLSKFDVSQTSAPGQIIIPKQFKDLFPQIQESGVATIGSQKETNFPIVFRGNGGANYLDSSRFIEYSPAPHHPRPNIEYRFTFHDRTINPGYSTNAGELSQDDILIFSKLEDEEDSGWFEIIHIHPSNALHSKLTKMGKRFGFIKLSLPD